jgi:hypothetical protein
MRQLSWVVVGALLVVFGLAGLVPAAEAKPTSAAEVKPAATGAQVTLKGVMMTEASCTSKPAKDADKTLVLFAVEGTPEVAATLDDIMKKHYPGDSIDADQARKILEEWERRLKYYITPGDLTAQKENAARWRNPAKAVTGVISEKDGKKWITPSKIEPAKLKYPDKMLAPDKPLAMPAKEPLLLKVDDALSLKCILLPAGRFFERVPFYATYEYEGNQMRYDDDYPRMVTLTKPFYLAEIPVTQEMYQAVMGSNPSEQQGLQLPVTRVPAADIRKFCQILSEKNGRNVRLPTAAQREYAARVGSSNPSTNANYADQVNAAPDGKSLLPVKSKQSNAWGLYDMFGCAWEIVGSGLTFHRDDEADPHSPGKDTNEWASHGGMGRNAFSWTTSREGVGDGTGTGYTLTKFRVAVDATPEEIAEMEKAAKK